MCVCVRAFELVSVTPQIVRWVQQAVMGHGWPGFLRIQNWRGRRVPGGSLVIVCGHVRRQSRMGGECQGVGIIADSILRA